MPNTSRKCSKLRAACAARLFVLFTEIVSLYFGVPVAVSKVNKLHTNSPFLLPGQVEGCDRSVFALP